MNFIRNLKKSWRTESTNLSSSQHATLLDTTFQNTSSVASTELCDLPSSSSFIDSTSPQPEDPNGNSMLHLACLHSQIDTIEELLRDHSALNSLISMRNHNNQTFLHTLALNDQDTWHIATRLLFGERDVTDVSIPGDGEPKQLYTSRFPLDIDALDEDGESALSYLLRGDKAELLRVLLSAGLPSSYEVSVTEAQVRGDNTLRTDYFASAPSRTHASSSRFPSVSAAVHQLSRANSNVRRTRGAVPQQRVSVSLVHACCLFNAPACLWVLLSAGASPDAVLLAPRAPHPPAATDRQAASAPSTQPRPAEPTSMCTATSVDNTVLAAASTRVTTAPGAACRHWRGGQLLLSLGGSATAETASVATGTGAIKPAQVLNPLGMVATNVLISENEDLCAAEERRCVDKGDVESKCEQGPESEPVRVEEAVPGDADAARERIEVGQKKDVCARATREVIEMQPQQNDGGANCEADALDEGLGKKQEHGAEDSSGSLGTSVVSTGVAARVFHCHHCSSPPQPLLLPSPVHTSTPSAHSPRASTCPTSTMCVSSGHAETVQADPCIPDTSAIHGNVKNPLSLPTAECCATAAHASALVESAVHACARLGRVQCLALLVAAGAHVGLRDLYARTPAHLACLTRNTALLPLLLLAPRLYTQHTINKPRTPAGYARTHAPPSHANALTAGTDMDAINSVRNDGVCAAELDVPQEHHKQGCGAQTCVRDMYCPCPSPAVVTALLNSHPALANDGDVTGVGATPQNLSASRCGAPTASLAPALRPTAHVAEGDEMLGFSDTRHAPDFPDCDYSGVPLAPWGSNLLSLVIHGSHSIATTARTQAPASTSTSSTSMPSALAAAGAHYGAATRELSVVGAGPDPSNTDGRVAPTACAAHTRSDTGPPTADADVRSRLLQRALALVRAVLATPLPTCSTHAPNRSDASSLSTRSSALLATSLTSALTSSRSTLLAEMLLCTDASAAVRWLLSRWPIVAPPMQPHTDVLKSICTTGVPMPVPHAFQSAGDVGVAVHTVSIDAVCMCVCDLLARDGVGSTALHRAAVALQPALINALLQHAQTSTQAAHIVPGITPAPDNSCVSSSYGSSSHLPLSLQPDGLGLTPLQWAVARGCRGEALALLRRAELRALEIIEEKR